MLEFPKATDMHQGIWLDIFPLYPAPPFLDEQSAYYYEVQRELIFALSLPQVIRGALKEGQQLAIEKKSLTDFLELPFRQKAAYYEDFLRKHPQESENVIKSTCVMYNAQAIFPASVYGEAIRLPFEKMMLPVMADYDLVLIVSAEIKST